jgi:hypothetical protein
MCDLESEDPYLKIVFKKEKNREKFVKYVMTGKN